MRVVALKRQGCWLGLTCQAALAVGWVDGHGYLLERGLVSLFAI